MQGLRSVPSDPLAQRPSFSNAAAAAARHRSVSRAARVGGAAQTSGRAPPTAPRRLLSLFTFPLACRLRAPFLADALFFLFCRRPEISLVFCFVSRPVRHPGAVLHTTHPVLGDEMLVKVGDSPLLKFSIARRAAEHDTSVRLDVPPRAARVVVSPVHRRLSRLPRSGLRLRHSVAHQTSWIYL